MSAENDVAQLQDVFYSIGGGSRYMFHSVDAVYEGTALPTIKVIYTLSEMNEMTITDEYPVGQSAPYQVTMPWYRRLWVFLNMDVREVWRLIMRKVK
jgi:hypothetical protein